METAKRGGSPGLDYTTASTRKAPACKSGRLVNSGMGSLTSIIVGWRVLGYGYVRVGGVYVYGACSPQANQVPICLRGPEVPRHIEGDNSSEAG
ncbi:hypothetical protein WJX79_009198 [Trebouxia sp. C0005]